MFSTRNAVKVAPLEAAKTSEAPESRTSIVLLLGVAMASLLLVPMLRLWEDIDMPTLKKSHLTDAVHNFVFGRLLSGCLAFAIPTLTDITLDLLDNLLNLRGKHALLERLVMLLTVTLPAATMLALPSYYTCLHVETAFVCFFYFQRLLCSAMALTILANARVYSFRICALLLVCFFAYAALDLIGLVIDSLNARIAGLMFFLVFMALGTGCIGVYLRGQYVAHRELLHDGKIVLAIQRMNHDEYAAFCVILGGAISFFGMFLGGVVLNRVYFVEDITIEYLYWHYACVLFFLVTLIILPARNLKRSEARLQVTLESKQRFVRYVGHEIRSPLSTVHLGLELLEAQLRSAHPDVVRTVRDLRLSCMTAVDVLNELIQYEQMEAGAMTLELAEVYPIPFLVSAVSPFMHDARQRSIQLEIMKRELDDAKHCGLDRVVLCVDQSKMTKVLRNFVSNAIKFSPEGAVSVSASLVHVQDLPFVRIEVRDSGCGIAIEHQTRIFREAVKLSVDEDQPGGGFGLMICKRIVDLHQGRVGLVSAGEGHGCTFFVELPVERAEKDFEDYGSLKEMVTGAPSRHNSLLDIRPSLVPSLPLTGVNKCMHVLVVDDAMLNRKVTVRMLESIGHSCEEAEDGDVALEVVADVLNLAAPVFDVVVLDNLMARMHGPETAERLRALGYKGMIVGLSGNSLEEDLKEFERRGANAVLVKPLDPKVFTTAVKSFKTANNNNR